MRLVGIPLAIVGDKRNYCDVCCLKNKMMNVLPDFKIEQKGKIADDFLKRHITTFHKAVVYIQNLEYGRNSNKDDLNTVFTDNNGNG